VAIIDDAHCSTAHCQKKTDRDRFQWGSMAGWWLSSLKASQPDNGELCLFPSLHFFNDGRQVKDSVL